MTTTILLALMLLGPSPNVESFLRAELAKRGARFNAINVTVPPFVPATLEAFEITQIQYDPVHLKTYFRVRAGASNDPLKHTFDVAVSGPILFPALIAGHDMAFGSEAAASDFSIDYRPPSALTTPSGEELAGRKTRRKILAGEVIHPEMFTPVVWVEAGRTAKFVISGDGFALSMPVVPLEAGAPGQSIRVRALETGRIFKAIVAGRDQLKGDYK
jgi:flagella basal body P-ring formation protein FlgA